MQQGFINKTRRNYGIWVGIGRAFVLNSRVPRLADRRVRKALTLALDFEWINQKFYHGERVRATSFWPSTVLENEGMPSEGELELLSEFHESLPPELFERPFDFPKGGSDEALRRNLKEASELLVSAGWRIVDGELRNENGEHFTLELLSFEQSHSRILLPWFKNLQKLGITLDAIPLAGMNGTLAALCGAAFGAAPALAGATAFFLGAILTFEGGAPSKQEQAAD